MIELTQRLKSPASDTRIAACLALPFELRQKSRLRTQLDNGEDVWLTLPRGEVVRGGDLLVASDGRIVQILAQPEHLLHVECETPLALARAAYHLGNRHVPVQVGAGFLRLSEDHVLEQMLRGLDVQVTRLEAPFEPEAGAYGTHSHDHAPRGEAHKAGRIHEYGNAGRS